jgi:hypothetical protein
MLIDNFYFTIFPLCNQYRIIHSLHSLHSFSGCHTMSDFAHSGSLFPLDGCRWFAGDVIDNAVYAANFVDNPVGDDA